MYKIEVATPEESTTKEKGDLLEKFVVKFLLSLNYELEQQIRLTAIELDILAKNKINNKTIYIECKAHRDPLSSNVLKNLLGTVELQEYSEGWLISTGEYGKDAKGFMLEWSKKPTEKSSKLSFYRPEDLIDSFIKSNTIIDPTKINLQELNEHNSKFGDWTLVISKYGNFWFLQSLEGGLPVGLYIFEASNGDLIKEKELLLNLSKTDTTLKYLDFIYYYKKFSENYVGSTEEKFIKEVVPVQQGESWDDYRPARPEDFVGREEEQRKIFNLFNRVLNEETDTRIFAITGNSGMGKSSLINMLINKSKNKSNKNKYFIYAVDIRAAKDHNYIYSALLKCFRESMIYNFIDNNELKITDISNPMDNDDVKNILSEIKLENKIICLIFDQFEELYSKSELFSIFEAVQRLLLIVASIKSNFCLGFAWKTDSTVHQNHPAYFIWHNLKDYRLTVDLEPFSRGDSERVLNVFDKQIEQKLSKEIKHQLISHSQGFPWLLKKLCIHLYSKYIEDEVFSNFLNETLDIQVLFEKDLQELSLPESKSLKLIAEKAPVDWYEIVDNIGNENIQSLINKRLIIRSGDRLNIYWDIFKEFILTKKVPSLPFNYLPNTGSVKTLLRVIEVLEYENTLTLREVAEKIAISEKTVGNIISDLQMFGIAKGKRNEIFLNRDIDKSNTSSVLLFLRKIFIRHSSTLIILKKQEGEIIKHDDMIKILKKGNLTANYNLKTLDVYINRIGHWLSILGFIEPEGRHWIVKNSGRPSLEIKRKHKDLGSGMGYTMFATSPKNTIELLNKFIKEKEINKKQVIAKGYKSGIVILKRLSLINSDKSKYYVNRDVLNTKNSQEILRERLMKEKVFFEVKEIIETHNSLIKGTELGSIINDKGNLNWSRGSIIRAGNSLKQWYNWINKK